MQTPIFPSLGQIIRLKIVLTRLLDRVLQLTTFIILLKPATYDKALSVCNRFSALKLLFRL